MPRVPENRFLFTQNPREADAMTKVQAELDETKIILVNYVYKVEAPNYYCIIITFSKQCVASVA